MPAALDTSTTFEDWKDLDGWQPAAFPDGSGGMWTWAEPAARTATKDGWLELDVPAFTRSHDHVQIFDNPKHLLACARPIPVPDAGLVVEVEMAGRLHGGPGRLDGSDWRDGFVSVNLMDFEHGFILDGLLNGKRSGALWERLHIPGMTTPEQAFTTIADGPASDPGQAHRFRFEYDPAAASVRAAIDGRTVLEAYNVPARIRSFTAGFGLVTLWPIRDGKSVSLKGQGATGRIGAIRTSTLR